MRVQHPFFSEFSQGSALRLSVRLTNTKNIKNRVLDFVTLTFAVARTSEEGRKEFKPSKHETR